MANETELIRAKMARTRESLRQKLDALEDRTLGVVKETGEVVAQVAETVEQTVETAKEAVETTVAKSARLLDINRQVDRHPWLMMGGAVATGFLASWLINRNSASAVDSRERREVGFIPPLGPQRVERAQPQQPERPSWLSGLMQTFGPGLDALKALAVGAAVDLARDVVMQNVPKEFSGQIVDMFGKLTEKLGGKATPPQPQPSTAGVGASEGETRRWQEQRSGHGKHHHPKKKSHGNGRHSESATR